MKVVISTNRQVITCSCFRVDYNSETNVATLLGVDNDADFLGFDEVNAEGDWMEVHNVQIIRIKE